MGFHRGIVPTADPNAGPHVVHQFQFVDAGAMSAGTDTLKGAVTLTAADVGMVCRVGAAAPYDFYILTNHVGPVWEQINGGGGGGGGDVTGPGSSNDNAIARYDGTTGKTIQNSGATIDDAGVITAAGLVTAGTVDGRDVSADGSALDAHIAAANPHSGSLGTAHEGAGGAVHANAVASGAAGFMTGADKAKLDGVEAGADVTDATNVAAAGAVMDADYAGSYAGDQIRTGAAAYAVVRHNRSATAAPTVNDDSTQNYEVGSRWFDTIADRAYTCLDASVGAAVWREVSVVAAAVAAAGAVMDSDFGGSYSADLTRTGAGTYAGLRNNLAATASPSATDDSASSYAVGSRWIDTTADRAWTCVDATPGAAVWIEGGGGGGGGGPPTVTYVTTPTISDFYQAASGNGDGSADFLVAVWARDLGPTRIGATPARHHIASGGKWEIFWNFGVLGFSFIDGTADNTINLGTSDIFTNLSYMLERDALFMLRVTGGGGTATIEGFINGGRAFSQAAANAGIGAGTAGLKLGGQGAFGATHKGGIQGAAYLDGTVTDSQIAAFTEACFVAGGIVAGGISWDSLYDHSAAPGATWADTIGSADLTRNGSPGAVTRQLRLA